MNAVRAIAPEPEPEPTEVQSAVERYRELYRAAGRTVEFGQTVRLGGVVAFGILMVTATVSYQMTRTAHAGFPDMAVTLLGCGLLAALVTHLWGGLFEARGRTLEQTIHALVLSSPVLSPDQREKVRTLRRRAKERESAPEKAA